MSSDEGRGPFCLPGCDRLDVHVAGTCEMAGTALVPGPLDLVHRHPDIPVHVPQRADAGIQLYDLAPPESLPPLPTYSPFRDARNRPPQIRYLPPPLPDGFARVELGDDYYLGPVWDDWAGEEADYPARVFDIPAEQRARWAKALADYGAMQEEIGALRAERLRTPGFAPPGWVRKGTRYQAQP